MKITAFNGSPRKNGNTRIVIEKILESASEKGLSTEIIDLNDMNIKGCQACYSCKKNGNNCVINDDMQKLHESVLSSDVIILGSPTYMWQVSAQTKLFTDRLYNFFNFNEPSKIKGKKLILLFTQGSQDPNFFSAYFEHFKNAFIFMGFDVIDSLVVPGIRVPGEVVNNDEIMQKISAIGEKLAGKMYS